LKEFTGPARISCIRCANKVVFHMMGCTTPTNENEKELVGEQMQIKSVWIRLSKTMLIAIQSKPSFQSLTLL
jgi:hypothetical protein